ncbi:MAG: hypothetical protein D6752_04670 [Candidatus Nitrosothermus koennekii]|nr:MAG: hypothetical protein D6752_04670 [Candidatus Nitrosothermus koennekii]
MSLNNYDQLQKELDQIIERLTKCILLYISNLEKSDDIDICNKTSNTLHKVSSVLIKLLKVRGIKLESNDTLAELLARLEEAKEVEEVLKDEI